MQVIREASSSKHTGKKVPMVMSSLMILTSEMLLSLRENSIDSVMVLYYLLDVQYF